MSKPVEVNLKCVASYLPLEAQIDRVSFEYLMMKSLPQHLVLINGTNSKIIHLKSFISDNQLEIKIEHVANSKFSLSTNTATK